jgi:enoyl-CoA hydratase/carnithine racemase
MAVEGADILVIEKFADRHFAIVTINREERGNSISLDLALTLADTWRDLQGDDEVRAVVLTGTGTKFFCTGDDLKDRARLDNEYPGGANKYVEDRRFDGRITPAANGLWKPVIGAINGYALAGGFYVAQTCDVRIAAEHAVFGLPEVRWNLPAPFAAQLQRMIPPAIAMEMALWGSRTFTAARMYEVGFVNKVVPAERLLDEAVAWAEEVAMMGPVAVQAHKELMYRYLYQDEASAERLGHALFEGVWDMEDTVEGPRAFVEGRAPEWRLK